MAPRRGDSRNGEQDGASPGKIFVGGLSKDTSLTTFKKYFEKYGEIIDSVIMKDRLTGRPRGFGFITYSDPSVVDKVIEETHVINEKQVEIKRTIPRSSAATKDFKTKKIFVGGIPTTVTEDDLKSFFSKHGKVVEHEIIRDHSTNRSRGFGFIVFDSEKVVDELLVNGNMIDYSGNQVEIKKAEPKKASNPTAHGFPSEPRPRPFGDNYGGPTARGFPGEPRPRPFGDNYGGYPNYVGGGGFGPSSYRTRAAFGPRPGDYVYGGSGYDSLGSNLGDYRNEASLSYTAGVGSYGGGYGGALGSYGSEDVHGSYGSSSYGGGYDSGPGTGYNSGGLYGRGSFGGAGRYHPYAR